MTPISSLSHSNNLSSSNPDVSAYDINRFNRTPKARHYARRSAERAPGVAADNTPVSQLIADAKSKTANFGPTFPEYSGQSHAEILVRLKRVNDTAKLIAWMRKERIEGR